MGVRKGVPEELRVDWRTERGEGACAPEESVPGPGHFGWETGSLAPCQGPGRPGKSLPGGRGAGRGAPWVVYILRDFVCLLPWLTRGSLY